MVSAGCSIWKGEGIYGNITGIRYYFDWFGQRKWWCNGMMGCNIDILEHWWVYNMIHYDTIYEDIVWNNYRSPTVEYIQGCVWKWGIPAIYDHFNRELFYLIFILQWILGYPIVGQTDLYSLLLAYSNLVTLTSDLDHVDRLFYA